MEADLLLQNLMLASRRWAWRLDPRRDRPALPSGHPYFAKETKGLDVPPRPAAVGAVEFPRWGQLLPACGPTRSGLDGVIRRRLPAVFKCMSRPPSTPWCAEKKALYGDRRSSAAFMAIAAAPTCDEVPFTRPEVIDCAKDICRYIYKPTAGSPPTSTACSSLASASRRTTWTSSYYDELAGGLGYTETQARHQGRWHGT